MFQWERRGLEEDQSVYKAVRPIKWNERSAWNNTDSTRLLDKECGFEKWNVPQTIVLIQFQQKQTLRLVEYR